MDEKGVGRQPRRFDPERRRRRPGAQQPESVGKNDKHPAEIRSPALPTEDPHHLRGGRRPRP